ncbi:MAG: carbon-nitrogen hydrolase family protein, partial [Ginsengibacter sp.]
MKTRSQLILHLNLQSFNYKFNFRGISALLLWYVLMFFIGMPAQCQQFNTSSWRFESQREAIAPVWYIDSNTTYNGNQTLALAGGGKAYADGHWYNTVTVEPGEYFEFRACFAFSKVAEPNRSILARILWQDGSGELVGFAEYPAKLLKKTNEGWSIIEEIYKIPAEAKTAKIELHYRWDADGIVHFGGISFQRSKPPEPRKVRVATINYKPENSGSSRENLEKFSELIARAAAQKADIVCLPEGITLAGTTLNYISASEPVPGPTTEFLGNIARKYNLYIVAGILERQGDVVYNTSVLIGRSGSLAGKYRKISLPREEIDGGVTPGDSLPVFDTDFGRIGMMICWDVSFPETARRLAQQGAEVIFLPIWGGNVTLAKARAIENQVYLVSSSYDMITAVFDQEGEVMKEATKDAPVVVVDIDLNKQKLWPWLGDFKNRIPGEMPPQKA